MIIAQDLIKICVKNECKTAFSTQYKYYKYITMLFRLLHTPANFEDQIIKTSAKKLDVFVIIYLNNSLVYIDKKSAFRPILSILDQLKKDLLISR